VGILEDGQLNPAADFLSSFDELLDYTYKKNAVSSFKIELLNYKSLYSWIDSI